MQIGDLVRVGNAKRWQVVTVRNLATLKAQERAGTKIEIQRES